MSGAGAQFGSGGVDTLVFHAGALGDSVMLWPLLRALARRDVGPNQVGFVAADSHAHLAQRWVLDGLDPGRGRVRAVSGESPWAVALWRGSDEARQRVGIYEGIREVYTVVPPEGTGGDPPWIEAARIVFPCARIERIGPPGSRSRRDLLARAGASTLGSAAARRAGAPRGTQTGPVLLHVGAGGEAKRWPLDRWLELAALLRRGGHVTELCAGPVEHERFSPSERERFARSSGRFERDPGRLAEMIARSRAVIACDTGPAHLSAQLGVPTVVLFGPTDPGVWAPVGPRVAVVRPPAPSPMSWLIPPLAASGLRGLLVDPGAVPS
ncbi:MAG: glycosyltransferase family 9 protein [Phycisphaerae bacterium]|nr:glycosyltransferase family 9 protein [Phycisphaerae bacterium]